MSSDSVRVGVLSLHNSKETKAIRNAVEDLGHVEYPLLLGRDILTDYRVDVRRHADADEAGRDEAGEILKGEE